MLGVWIAERRWAADLRAASAASWCACCVLTSSLSQDPADIVRGTGAAGHLSCSAAHELSRLSCGGGWPNFLSRCALVFSVSVKSVGQATRSLMFVLRHRGGLVRPKGRLLVSLGFGGEGELRPGRAFAAALYRWYPHRALVRAQLLFGFSAVASPSRLRSVWLPAATGVRRVRAALVGRCSVLLGAPGPMWPGLSCWPL